MYAKNIKKKLLKIKELLKAMTNYVLLNQILLDDIVKGLDIKQIYVYIHTIMNVNRKWIYNSIAYLRAEDLHRLFHHLCECHRNQCTNV